nr:MAG TPA: hypothetical protein [Caudoviricetes sp.]
MLLGTSIRLYRQRERREHNEDYLRSERIISPFLMIARCV